MPTIERSGLRADRGFYTQPIWAGLLASAIYVLYTPGPHHRIPETTANVIAAVIAASTLTCLVASCLKNWRLAFQLELAALLVIIAACGFLDIKDDVSLFEAMTFQGGLTAWVQIGSARLAYHLWRQLRIPDAD